MEWTSLGVSMTQSLLWPKTSPTARCRPTTRLLLLGALSLGGCGPRGAAELGPTAYYRTGFPLGDVSGQLEALLPSIVRVQIQAHYLTYAFEEDNAPTVEELHRSGGAFVAQAVDVRASNTTRVATAVVVAWQTANGRGTLVTTNHALSFPDTVFEYFGTGGAAPALSGPRIARAAIKQRQVNTAVGRTFVEPFDIIARSPETDLALIGVRVPGVAPLAEMRPLPAPIGSSRRLSWGSLVYVLGHAAGHLMVTRAIVSKSDDDSDSFLTDGLLNEGTSGSPILAVRGSTDEIEWVGIARATASRSQYRLMPGTGVQETHDPLRPYEGPIYLRQEEEVRYGISFSIPISDVRAFISGQRSRLGDARYPIPGFI